MFKTQLALLVCVLLLIGLTSCNTKPSPDAAPAPPAASSPEASSGASPWEVPLHDTAAFPFYEDGEFLDRAYAMGYTDRLLETLWEGGCSKESLLAPLPGMDLDTSPNGKHTLYAGSSLSLEPLWVKNHDTGEVRVIDTGGTVANANLYFASDDSIGVFGSTGGALYSLLGEELLSVTLDPEAMGYVLLMPAYYPPHNSMVGLGTGYKTYGSITRGYEISTVETFGFFEVGLDGELLHSTITDIPLEVNRYRQIIQPNGTYLRDGAVWMPMVTLDGSYPFYRIRLEPSSHGQVVEEVDSATFRAAFPHYSRKG